MKRIYLIKYYKNFGNTYLLRYVTSKELLEAAIKDGYGRITRVEAINKARDEISRRKYDPSFGGYADDCIYPFDNEYCDPEPKYPYIVI